MQVGFKIGDIVLLKSGGPIMTVQSIKDETIYCTWFDDNNIRKQEYFNTETLKLKEKK